MYTTNEGIEYMKTRRSWWAWGVEGAGPTPQEELDFVRTITSRFGSEGVVEKQPVPIDAANVSSPKLELPDSLKEIVTVDRYERVRRTYGRGYMDIVRGFYGDFSNAPDVVASPRTEQQLCSVLEWAGDIGAAVVPYGGGSSVAGGVDGGGDWAGNFAGVVTIDLEHFNRVLEVDPVSRAARVQAGVLGPHLEDQLRAENYTLRHFPQSFEFSSLGGWLATRAGGHYATGYTHIDDLVESIRMVTPTGTSESRRLPGSGAGPSPDRLVLGSEGILGVITEAWMRIQERPRYRASLGVTFDSYDQGVAATREVAQAGLFPSNCRLLEMAEANPARASEGGAVLVLGFESADHPVDSWITRGVEICEKHGGRVPEGIESEGPDSASTRRNDGLVGTWRRQFIVGPYLMATQVRHGIFGENYETACTWSEFEALHTDVVESVREVIRTDCQGRGDLTCRFTHVYPDGPAPYFTVRAVAGHGRELEVRERVENAISEAFLRNGGTITHHHAVGRQRRPWYDQQRPDFMARALAATKAALDPQGLLNPGVLIDPIGASTPSDQITVERI
jgi:alkyldihydroxyacetonephosphate synthase